MSQRQVTGPEPEFNFDPNVRLFLPIRTASVAEEVGAPAETSKPGSAPCIPFYVDAKEGKFGLVLSAATLVLVCLTAYFTGRQLGISTTATHAAQEAAYQACVGSKISRAALIESQKAMLDSHQASVAAFYQAVVATQSEAAVIEPSFKLPTLTPGESIDAHMQITNVGKLTAFNLEYKARAVFLRVGESPDLRYPINQTQTFWVPRLSVGNKLFVMGNMVASDEVTVTTKTGKMYVPTLQDLADWQARRSDIFVFGEVSYSDAIGLRSLMRFCGQFRDPNSLAPRTKVNEQQDAACKLYNRTITGIGSLQLPASGQLPISPALPEIVCTKPDDEKK